MSEVKTNKITSLASNNDITIDPDGTGKIAIPAAVEVDSNDITVAFNGADDVNSLILQGSNGSSEKYTFELQADGGGSAAKFMIGSGGGAASEKMRIDASGNVLVGKATTSTADQGIQVNPAGRIDTTSVSAEALRLNRKTSDGDIAVFRKDNTTVGSINVEGGDLCIGNDDSGLQFNNAANSIRPFNIGTNAASDNVLDLGQSGDRFDDIFATNGTIQTSDQNEKQNIASLTTAEITAAKAISKLFKTFKWNDKVAAKGDAARTHSGVIAQEVQTAMTNAGLDAADYAFWCSDTWWETSTDVAAVEADEEAGIEARDAYTRINTYQTADEAPEGATQRTRLGIRYPELLAFVGAATEQRLADLETRVTALENA